MDVLIWVGTALTLGGIAGLVACIVATARARRAGHDDATLRAKLKRIVAYNLGALMLSALGLMCVIAGVMLG